MEREQDREWDGGWRRGRETKSVYLGFLSTIRQPCSCWSKFKGIIPVWMKEYACNQPHSSITVLTCDQLDWCIFHNSSSSGTVILGRLSQWCSCPSHCWRNNFLGSAFNTLCSAWFDPALALCVSAYYTLCALSALGKHTVLNSTYGGSVKDVFGLLPVKPALVMLV